MGAAFLTLRIEGTADRNRVSQIFAEAQEQDRYENGHSYSGGFGMASGLLFEGGPEYGNGDDARKHLIEHCQKWEEARAVRYKDKDGVAHWLIGAWCAS